MRARAPRRDPQLVERLRAMLGHESVRATHKLEEVDDALRDFQDRCVETLVLVGGDGTVGVTLTRAVELWASDLLPRVALAGGGTVSTLAKSLRARGDPDRTIRRLLERNPTEHCRPLVGVRAQGRALRYGMIFAMGGATRFLERYYNEGGRSRAPGAGLFRAWRSALETDLRGDPHARRGRRQGLGTGHGDPPRSLHRARRWSRLPTLCERWVGPVAHPLSGWQRVRDASRCGASSPPPGAIRPNVLLHPRQRSKSGSSLRSPPAMEPGCRALPAGLRAGDFRGSDRALPRTVTVR